MSTLDAVLAVAGHKSTILTVTGALHLLLFAIRRSPDPRVKRADTYVSVALFPVGLLQTLSLCSYIVELLVGGRALVYSPYFQVFEGGWVPGAATAAYGFTMGAAAFSATAQLGRKFPYSVMVGGGLAVVTGGGVWSLASGVGVTGAVVMGGCTLIALLMFMVGYWVTKPYADLYKVLGTYTAFSPVVLLTSLGATMLGIISGMGLVVL
jgi:hypothetical protein